MATKAAARYEQQNHWVDYGPNVEIQGHTFVKQDSGYIHGDLVWAFHNQRGNYFGMLPAIVLSQQEFFDRLTAMRTKNSVKKG